MPALERDSSDVLNGFMEVGAPHLRKERRGGPGNCPYDHQLDPTSDERLATSNEIIFIRIRDRGVNKLSGGKRSGRMNKHDTVDFGRVEFAAA